MRKWSVWVAAAGATALLVWGACGGDEPVEIGPDPPTTTATTSDGGHGATGGTNQGGTNQGGTNQGGTNQGGENNSSVAGYVSGSRLRARYYQGTDGSRAYVGLYDSQLGVDCYFAPTTDGKSRCVPSELTASTFYFTDASCTQPGVIVAKGCAAATYASRLTSSCAGNIYEVRTVGQQATGFYTNAGGPCVDQTAVYGVNYDFYTLGASVAPSTFVEGVETIE